MSFALTSPKFFDTARIPPGHLSPRDAHRLQTSEAEFILSSESDISYWMNAHFANCTYEDLAGVYRAWAPESGPGVAWLLCSRNPLRAVQKINTLDRKLNWQQQAKFDGGSLRLALDQDGGGEKYLDFSIIVNVLLYADVLDDVSALRLCLPPNLRPLSQYLETLCDFEIVTGEALSLEVRIPHPDAVMMRTYNPTLEPWLEHRPKLAMLARAQDPMDEIRQTIEETIAQENFSLTDLADTLRTSRRTLQRRMARAGTSFSELRDEMRIKIIQDGFSQNVSIDQLVDRLGFRDISAIYKLRRRAGASPNAPAPQRRQI